MSVSIPPSVWRRALSVIVRLVQVSSRLSALEERVAALENTEFASVLEVCPVCHKVKTGCPGTCES